MNIFSLLTPMTYWLLIALWSFILVFYLKRIRAYILKRRLVSTLLIILAIDAFRTLFESLYFGAWYTALAGFLPLAVHAFLVRPEMVFIPKIINVIAAITVIAILLFRWLPQEEEEKEELNKLIAERTLALARSNKKLQKEISERRATQKRLQGYAENLNTIFDSTPNILVLVNEEGRVDMINHRGAALLGHEKEGVIGLLGGEVFNCLNSFEDDGCGRNPECSRCPVRGRVMSTFETGTPRTEEEGRLTLLLEGKQRTMDLLISTSLLELDAARKVLLSLTDISARKRAERELHESEQKFKSMFDQAPLSYQSLNRDGRFIEVNETWLKTLGYERGEVIGNNFGAFLEPGLKSHFEDNFKRFKSVGEILGVEFDMLKKDGSSILVSFHGKLEKDKHGIFKRTHCVLHDITAQRAAEDSANREMMLNRGIADISKELLSKKYDIKRVSDKVLEYARKLTESPHGFASAIDRITLENVGHTLTEMYGKLCRVEDQRVAFPIGEDGKYNALWGHALNTKESFFTNDPVNHPLYRGVPEGHIPLNRFLAIPVKAGDLLMGLIALANSDHEYSQADIRAVERLAEVYALALHRQQYEVQRKEFEQQLNQLQKMEALGTLAGGIAHDFNNILSPIIGYTELLDEDLPDNSVLRENTEKVLTATKRARDLVKQILTFSRQAEQEIKPLKPHLVLKEVIKLMRATIPSTIEIRTEIDPDTKPILADPTKIHQIAMNIITNAYHAMQNQVGTLSVVLRNSTAPGEERGNPPPIDGADVLAPLQGPCVLLSISDTGVGMGINTTDKIFDPYFSTKPKDKGTGLGLSVVHGIVKSYGGEIRVKSRPGEGSVFDVFLPAIQNDPATEEGSGGTLYPTGHERILLVDDEEPVARIGQRMLERLGYTVDIRFSSIEALETVKATPDLHDLVITDMTMPGMTGDQLALEILKIRSEMPIVICTGFSERISPEKAAAKGIKGYLMKPLLKKELASLVRRMLDPA